MNKYTGVRIEYHILQSFPATCLNRDDVGSPKSVVIGGVERSRVSSQCWKRQVRLALQELGICMAYRTRCLPDLLLKLYPEGVSEQKADTIKKISDCIVKDNTLFFVSQAQIEVLKSLIDSDAISMDDGKTSKSKKKKNDDKEESSKTLKLTPEQLGLLKEAGRDSSDALYALDIALFGRFVAKVNELNVEAACSFSHAFTTHKASSDLDYFSAIDDCALEFGVSTATAHLANIEYSTGTYYRYINLDLGILQHNLDCSDEDLLRAVEVFTKALYMAVPSARQKSFAGYCPWDYARVLVRRGQAMQLSFDKPVRSLGNGYLEPSIKALEDGLTRNKKLMGSLYGELGTFSYGDSEDNGIDELCSGLRSCVEAIR